MNDDIPSKLKPFLFHGIELGKPHNNEYPAECIFCGKYKFSVNSLTGKWKCWSCGKGTDKGGGNAYTFLRLFLEICMDQTSIAEYKQLAQERGLLDSQPLIEWNVAKSVTTNDWLVPGYNPERKLNSLYRYIQQHDKGYRLLPTPTLGHHIHGMNLWDNTKPIVYICEGPWDALALWEVLTRCKTGEQGLCETASREHSLYAQANVIAVPGCEVFFESWLPLFENKIVNLLYDSDHPRKHPKTGHVTEGAGWRGMQRVTRLFASSSYPPQELNCLHWGPDGYDPSRKSGYDIRDLLTKD